MDDQQRKLAEELLFSGLKKAPSFGKKLFAGALETTHVFPFPKIHGTDDSAKHLEIESFLASIKAFADEKIDGNQIDRQSCIPDDVIQGLGRLGVLGMTIPSQYGGLGMSQHVYCQTAEILSRRCGSTALFVNAHQSVGLKALLLFGTEAQKQRWLPPLAKGEFLAAFSLTEPNAGSDASAIETRAVFDPEKNVWRLNGKKQWTTNGAIAEVLTVMARTEIDTDQGKQDKITAFLVNPSMPGFKVTEPSLEKVGMRGTKTANLEFHDMEVPAENILGPLGGGLKVCLTVLDFGRTTFGATCTGAAKYLLERSIQHVKERYQFKRPLGSFGLVKKKIATMSALVYAMESATYLTASLVDKGVEDFMLEAAMLKVFASDSLWSILYETMQIFGGRSFFVDQPFERMMRDARLNMIGEGSNEVMRAFIAAVGMRDVAFEIKGTVDALLHPVDQFEALKGFGKQWFDRVAAPQLQIVSPQLQDEAAQIGKAVRSFGFAVGKMIVKYQEKFVEKQLSLDRIATSAMALYTSVAVLSRIDAALQVAKAENPSINSELAIAKLYCKMANRTIQDSLSALSDNDDDAIEALSDSITGLKKI